MNPRESGVFIESKSKEISILDSGIDKASKLIFERLENGEISLNNIFKSNNPIHPNYPDEDGVNWMFFVDLLNFSFWTGENDEKYTVTYKDVTYTGYLALCAAIKRTLDLGVKIYSIEVLKKLSLEDLEKYFQGDNDVSVPLIEKRLEVIKESIDVLSSEKFNGSFYNMLKTCDCDALKLLDMIQKYFPCFRDYASYEGNSVKLLKRAQILIADIWILYKGQGLGNFKNISSLTCFPDYRVPQSLLYLGVFKYSDTLLSKLKSNKELINGEPIEVEIRGCTIRAVDKIAIKMRQNPLWEKFPWMNDCVIDFFLWGLRRELADEMEAFPYHKTRSIFY